ncbi:hypothetical protein NZD88_00375 [Chryseobacterium antibioticum]|uniref:DUF3139 domain-containing protein n=1 Tax=Chryseobacterium pyrolae TaxID=2987481 RepID=A0ABT2IBJ7_9FLAO|nr:hypothetical protein [Chryseobacterium pyrolae]MCT2406005.1 hypothetical protein [Chryseobacterium pyrolae]
MKKAAIVIISILLVIIVSLTIYWNLPIDITRRADIQYGNSLIQNIEIYKKTNHYLPEINDWETLNKLGFKKEDLGAQPDYRKNGNGSYELIYLDDLGGPYLIWNSNEKKWSIDFPKIQK